MLWLRGKMKDKPNPPSDASFTGILIDRSHRIWHVERNLVPGAGFREAARDRPGSG